MGCPGHLNAHNPPAQEARAGPLHPPWLGIHPMLWEPQPTGKDRTDPGARPSVSGEGRRPRETGDGSLLMLCSDQEAV